MKLSLSIPTLLLLCTVTVGCDDSDSDDPGASDSAAETDPEPPVESDADTDAESDSDADSDSDSGPDPDPAESDTDAESESDTDGDSDSDTDGDSDSDSESDTDEIPEACDDALFPEPQEDCGAIESGDCENEETCAGAEVEPCVLAAIEAGSSFTFGFSFYSSGGQFDVGTQYSVADDGRHSKRHGGAKDLCEVEEHSVHEPVDLSACADLDCIVDTLDAEPSIVCVEEQWRTE